MVLVAVSQQAVVHKDGTTNPGDQVEPPASSGVATPSIMRVDGVSALLCIVKVEGEVPKKNCTLEAEWRNPRLLLSTLDVPMPLDLQDRGSENIVPPKGAFTSLRDRKGSRSGRQGPKCGGPGRGVGGTLVAKQTTLGWWGLISRTSGSMDSCWGGKRRSHEQDGVRGQLATVGLRPCRERRLGSLCCGPRSSVNVAVV